MQFKDIVGQKEVKQKLIKSVKESRIAHAQLLAGKEGTGKLALAIAYAQYISCQNRSEDDSCGECPSCHKFQKLIHPDLHFVFPVNETKKEGDDETSRRGSDAHMQQWRETILENPYVTESQWYAAIGIENKQGIINTGESSEVIKKISLKSFESEYKTMIIWLPERLNISAANRLLKLIEEPPGKTVFIMVSEQPNRIISTILSRTQIIKVPPISREEIAVALVDRYSIDPNKAHDDSRVANGNFNKAMALALLEETSPYFELFVELMRASFSNNILALLEWTSKVSRLGREKQKELISYSLAIIRESFMLNLGLEDIVYITGDEKKFSQNFSPFINSNNILQVYNTFNLATEHISRNGNSQIIFTDMTMKLVKLINKL
ncbi:MAG: DNA polymerase III subunit delta [Bacteroidales bacterium]|jgi:DNA polymerase-3 subunit delta'|nr:DNA polymerase III subunit delta [Bacteroidales bacterium]MDD4384125.1 DNA polymerase III subunit delta [Bacteroidales bacterium]MDY0197183.1 DNA polymerase III subunit delta [Tenuifilaceae bacterium]